MIQVRCVELVELWVICAAWLLIVEPRKKKLGRHLYRACLAITLAPVTMMLAVGLNLLVRAPATAGAYLAVGLLCIVAVVLVAIFVGAQRHQLKLYDSAVDDLAHEPDCSTPGCMNARHRFRQIRSGAL